ncbi:Sucrose transport protein [Serratia proteamaculans]|uniref:oligosaccharide MFS transporter n=1 Tax=Serratia proteamaculans TaxID=28151 RepID=UPI0009F7A5AC|nr:oligosaccharide MFS transporter [Serratia proteamaculans]SMB43091.1 Sucrose transport protein [Serratia proteamaculans]
MDTFKNKRYIEAVSYAVFFYAAISFATTFYAIWLSSKINLTASQTGFVYALNAFVSLFFMVIYGLGQDRLGIRKNLLWVQNIAILGCGPFFIYIYEPMLNKHFYAGTLLGAVYLSIAFFSGMGLIDSYIDRLSRIYNFEFGTARMGGSLSAAIVAFIAGRFIAIDPHINFWCISLAGVGLFFVNLIFKADKSLKYEKEAERLTMKEQLSIFTQRRFWVFVIYIFGTYSLYNVYDQQLFPVFYTHQFDNISDGYKLYGYLGSVQVFLEAGMMCAAPFLVNKLGAKRSLVLAAFLSAFRIILSGYFTSIAIISCMKLFHAFEISIILVSAFKYIAINFDRRFSASVFLIGFQIAGSVGVISLSSFIGIIYDKYGYQLSFYILGGVVLAFMLFAMIFLKNDTPKEKQKSPERNTI